MDSSAAASSIDVEQLYAELKREKRAKEEALERLEESKKENQFLKDKVSVLERNISSLYTTANIEMQRKDKEIHKLRETVETRTLELERKEDLKQRAYEYMNNLHESIQRLQGFPEQQELAKRCEELLKDTIHMIFEQTGS